MKALLLQLGFTHITGPLFTHEKIGVITVDIEKDTPDDLVGKIYHRGYGECQEVIKSSLGINPKP